jgi:hypothetical protein
MKNHNDYLHELTTSGEFRLARLEIPDIDNEPVIRVNAPDIVEQEQCLFHRDVAAAVDYLDILHAYVLSGVNERRPAPVVRFADGEYAFYRYSLECNGLYRQAESKGAIRRAMPLHIAAFRSLSESGKLAPLVFPGNVARQPKRGLFAFLRRSGEEGVAVSFLNFLRDNGIRLTDANYVPFYAVYAYLTSEAFARLADKRKLCILNADSNPEACRQWFARFASEPTISCIDIPAEYVATQWETMRADVLKRVPPDTDICLTGAGVGALLVCCDVAARFRIPVIDAGHVLNMMNGREDKSNGARLYTIRKSKGPLPGAPSRTPSP